MQVFRRVKGHRVRVRLTNRVLRRRLRPGRYRIEIAAGRSRSTPGAAKKRTLRVTR